MKPETIVLGASGYAGGELLRLLRGHPIFAPAIPVSESSAGRRIGEVFPHLEGSDLSSRSFTTLAEALAGLSGAGPLALFSCAAHGASAAPIQAILAAARESDRCVRVVDLAADFRLGSVTAFEEVYGKAHGAPGLVGAFECLLPELAAGKPETHVAHPGCFTTAVVLGAAPLVAAGLIEEGLQVSAVTGSSGSGGRPAAGTHHPTRHGNIWAYGALSHRHRHEMVRLLEPLGDGALPVAFTPVSGPFARGIHALIHVRLREERPAEELLGVVREFYAEAAFVSASLEPPRLKDVVGTNHCRLGIAADGRRAVILSVIDNLTKGAAGGALQWMNRFFDLPETCGLDLAPPAWF